MARTTRLRRDLPIDIDTMVLRDIALAVGATHKQYMTAYSRALKRTAATMRKRAMADIKDGLAPRSMAMVRKRLLSFRVSRGSLLDEGRLWFGLNAIKVKDLKGRINGRMRPHHTAVTRKPGVMLRRAGGQTPWALNRAATCCQPKRLRMARSDGANEKDAGRC
ncbi:Uncharacterised protein [Serratia rubidaea]|uniref:Uncharacterized protein n=1 Tax=Serratia rubidaea TaxID=61652 RepID=A0A4U9HGG5_SERRU|nr:Uncharacterised protein [Serratia rubidaea]